MTPAPAAAPAAPAAAPAAQAALAQPVGGLDVLDGLRWTLVGCIPPAERSGAASKLR